MLEATKQEGRHPSPEVDVFQPAGQLHQIRWMLPIERSIAELRSIP